MPKVNELHFNCYPQKMCPADFFETAADTYELERANDCFSVLECPILSTGCKNQKTNHLLVFELAGKYKLAHIISNHQLMHFNFLTWCCKKCERRICDDEKLIDKNSKQILHPYNNDSHKRCVHNIAEDNSDGALKPPIILGSAMVWSGLRAAHVGKYMAYTRQTWPTYYWFCYWVHMAIEGAELRRGEILWEQLWDLFKIDYANILKNWLSFSEIWIVRRKWHSLIRGLATETVGRKILQKLAFGFVDSLGQAADIEENPVHWHRSMERVLNKMEIAAKFSKDSGLLINEFNKNLGEAKLDPLDVRCRPRAFGLAGAFFDYNYRPNPKIMYKWMVPFVTWAVWAQSKHHPVVNKIKQKDIRMVLGKIEKEARTGEQRKLIKSSNFELMALYAGIDLRFSRELKEALLSVFEALKLQ